MPRPNPDLIFTVDDDLAAVAGYACVRFHGLFLTGIVLDLQGSAHSTEQPANSQSNSGSRVGLGFDRVAEPGIKCRRGLTSRISGSPIQLLRSARRLVHCPFSPRLGVACYGADAFLKPAAILADSTFNSIFVHDLSPGWIENPETGRTFLRSFEFVSAGQPDFRRLDKSAFSASMPPQHVD
jgi:hypothetical protein